MKQQISDEQQIDENQVSRSACFHNYYRFENREAKKDEKVDHIDRLIIDLVKKDDDDDEVEYQYTKYHHQYGFDTNKAQYEKLEQWLVENQRINNNVFYQKDAHRIHYIKQSLESYQQQCQEVVRKYKAVKQVEDENRELNEQLNRVKEENERLVDRWDNKEKEWEKDKQIIRRQMEYEYQQQLEQMQADYEQKIEQCQDKNKQLEKIVQNQKEIIEQYQQQIYWLKVEGEKQKKINQDGIGSNGLEWLLGLSECKVYQYLGSSIDQLLVLQMISRNVYKVVVMNRTYNVLLVNRIYDRFDKRMTYFHRLSDGLSRLEMQELVDKYLLKQLIGQPNRMRMNELGIFNECRSMLEMVRSNEHYDWRDNVMKGVVDDSFSKNKDSKWQSMWIGWKNGIQNKYMKKENKQMVGSGQQMQIGGEQLVNVMKQHIEWDQDEYNRQFGNQQWDDRQWDDYGHGLEYDNQNQQKAQQIQNRYQKVQQSLQQSVKGISNSNQQRLIGNMVCILAELLIFCELIVDDNDELLSVRNILSSIIVDQSKVVGMQQSSLEDNKQRLDSMIRIKEHFLQQYRQSESMRHQQTVQIIQLETDGNKLKKSGQEMQNELDRLQVDNKKMKSMIDEFRLIRDQGKLVINQIYKEVGKIASIVQTVID